MPSEYECSSCKLGFCLGTYHKQIPDDGYFGRTQCVCMNCGLQHSLQLPMLNSDVPHTLESQPDLLIDAFLQRRSTRKLQCPYPKWIRLTKLEHGRLEELHCQQCDSQSLSAVWKPEGAPCPNCSTHFSSDPVRTWFT